MKNIAILGSTGSIGTQTLNIIRKNPEKFHACALTCKSNLMLIAEQIAEFLPEYAAVSDREDALKLKKMLEGRRACDVCGVTEGGACDLGEVKESAKEIKESAKDAGHTKILWGREGLNAAASEIESDIVLNALVGMAGLEPTYHAVLKAKTVALANKETLVAGGALSWKPLRARVPQSFLLTVNTAPFFNVFREMTKSRLKGLFLQHREARSGAGRLTNLRM